MIYAIKTLWVRLLTLAKKTSRFVSQLFQEQEIIVLVGVPSIKHEDIVYSRYFHKIITVKNLQKSAVAVRKELEKGNSVIVYRPNVKRKERKIFLDISRTYKVKCKCEVLPTNHWEDVPNYLGVENEEKQDIHLWFLTNFQAPLHSEGFSSIRYHL